MTINSDLVAHLVKLIPGRREKWFLRLLAEWHDAWKFLSDNPNYYLLLLFLLLLLLESNDVSFYPPLWGRTGAWFILLVSLLLLLSEPISVVDGCFWFVPTKQVVSGLLQPALVRLVAQSPTNWAEASPKTWSPPHSYRVGRAFCLWSRIYKYRKIQQMRPAWLCIFSDKQLEDTCVKFDPKAGHHQFPMKLGWSSSGCASGKKNAISVTLKSLRQANWGFYGVGLVFCFLSMTLKTYEVIQGNWLTQMQNGFEPKQ